MGFEQNRAPGSQSDEKELDPFALLETAEVPEFDVLVASSIGGVRKRILWAGGDDGFGRVEVYDLRENEAFIVPVDTTADAQEVFSHPLRNKDRGVPTDMLDTYQNFDGMEA